MLSIVIPVHNGAPYVREAIESALMQTVSDCEIVVVDNASTDGTAEILQQFRRNGRVQLNRHEELLAPAANWVKAIQCSQNPYFVVLGADDRLHPRFAELAMKTAQQDPSLGMIWFGWNAIDSSGTVCGRGLPQFTGRFTPGEFLDRATRQGQMCPPTTIVFSREVYDAVGGIDVNLRCCLDFDVILRVGAVSYSLGSNEVAADYRYHASQHSAKLHLAIDGGDSDYFFAKIPRYEHFQELHRVQLVNLFNAALFQSFSRRFKSDVLSSLDVSKTREEIRSMLQSWAMSSHPYARRLRFTPEKFTQRWAWRLSSSTAGAACARTAWRLFQQFQRQRKLLTLCA